MWNRVITPNLKNGPMMHYFIFDGVVTQTKHPISVHERERATFIEGHL